MRTLDDHKVNPANDKLTVEVMDEPGAGGANHHYEIRGYNVPGAPEGSGYTSIRFQNGPIAEAGVNGLTHEALLSILIDRMHSFQAGPYANEYNAMALYNLKTAQDALKQRTKERMKRGVEGTHAA